MDTSDWLRASSIEAYSGNGVEIRIKGIQLNESEQNLASLACDRLYTDLSLSIYLRDEATQVRFAATKAELLKCFSSPIYVKEFDNPYSPYSAPGLAVTTCRGVIKVWWRKRVISLDWDESEIKANAESLFTDDVTKYDRHIHAHTYADLGKYIKGLMEQP